MGVFLFSFMPRKMYEEQFRRVLQKPVFSVRDLANLGVPSQYARLRLHRLSAVGKITHIERGKYTTLDDPVLVASHITEPCYITLWSALSLRELTTQIPFAVQVATTRQRYAREIVFQGNTIRFHRMKQGMMFGYENVLYGDRRIPLARVEKIIIDALYLRMIPLGELKNAIAEAEPEKLAEYAMLTGSAQVMKTVEKVLGC